MASLPSKRQISVPSSRTSTRGAWSAKRAGRRPSNMSGRLDDVVVHADEHQVLEAWVLALPPATPLGTSRRAFPDTRVGDSHYRRRP